MRAVNRLWIGRRPRYDTAMTAIIVREAGAPDIAVLAAFARLTYAMAFGASFAPGDLEQHLTQRLCDAYFAQASRDDTFLLAMEPDLVGFAQIGQAQVEGGESGDMQLRRLYVHPDRQNGGIGSMLMNTVLAHPRLKNARRLYLDVWEKNDAARRLYERFGFSVAGTVPFVSPSGIVTGHDLLMLRALP